MATLVVILPHGADSPLIWGIVAAGKLMRSGRHARGQPLVLGADEAVEKTIAVVPGSAVLLRSVRFPPQAENQMRKSAAFMLEDDVAVDTGEMHFAVGAAYGDGARPVAAVAQSAMAAWQAEMQGLGHKADVLVPDFLTLAAPDHGVTMVDLGAQVIVANGRGLGFSAEPTLLEWIAAEALADARGIHLVSDHPEPLMNGALRAYREITTVMPLGDAHRLESAAAYQGLNLLQGAHAPRRDWRAAGQVWRRAGVLVGMTAAAALALLVVDSLRLNRHAVMATARAEAVFRQALPEVKRVVNPRVQMRTELQDLKAKVSNGFLEASTVLFAVVAENADTEIQALRFDARRGETTALLLLPSYDAIERIRTGVQQRGGVLQEGGARQDGNRIVADITVRVP